MLRRDYTTEKKVKKNNAKLNTDTKKEVTNKPKQEIKKYSSLTQEDLNSDELLFNLEKCINNLKNVIEESEQFITQVSAMIANEDEDQIIK
ncbi:hypothetical protein LJC10_04545 [Selenomonadales bacterium OttesenSCG-928-I06]|nr:hypothetical protein [Selenomonadales bacterium OttesenSCG-928-I06]